MTYITTQPSYVLCTSRFQESLVLRDGISHFYEFVTDRAGENELMEFPSACLDILFCCDPDMPEAVVRGITLSHRRPKLRADRRYFGIRFECGFFPTFLASTMSDMRDQCVPLSVLTQAAEILEKIVCCTDFKDRIACFWRYYIRQMGKLQIFFEKTLVEAAVQRMLAENGEMKVQTLADEMHYSRRCLEKNFRNALGISPNQMNRVIKFQNFLFQLSRNPRASLTELSVQNGYYDQSHLIREFKSFTALTPRSFSKIVISSDYLSRLQDLEGDTSLERTRRSAV